MIKAKFIFYLIAFILLTIIGIINLPKEEIIIKPEENNVSGESSIKKIYVHIDGAIMSPRYL